MSIENTNNPSDDELVEFIENQNNEYNQRLQDMYTYTDDGFCDGFTKY